MKLPLLLTLLALLCQSAQAEEFLFAGMVLSTDDMPEGECQVLRFDQKKPVGILTIPVTAPLEGKQLRITRIGNGAFWGCTQLKAVRLPKPMRTLDDLAFVGCSGLTEFNFPADMESVEYNTFKGCTALKRAKVVGWKHLTSLVRGLPMDCQITVYDPETETSTVVSFADGGLNYVELPGGECLLAGDPGRQPRLAVPAQATNAERQLQVTRIGESAFYHRDDLAAVTFAPGLHTIGTAAFSGCTALKSITLPAGLTTIEGFAFWGCEGLTQVTLPTSLRSIGREAFSGCKALPRVALPAGLQTIGPEAFWDCQSLTAVTLPASIKSIANEAFYGCLSLAAITLPEGLTSIGEAAFEGCSGLKALTLPRSLAKLGHGAFRDCQNLQKVKLPDWSKLKAFAQGLPRRGPIVVTDPKTKADKTISQTLDGVTYWELPGGQCLVAACGYEVDNPVIPAAVGAGNLKVVGVAAEAFGGCDGMVTCTLPASVASIGRRAFYRCRALGTVQMGLNTEVAPDAFEGCDRIDYIEVVAPAGADVTPLQERLALDEHVEFSVVGN